MAEAKSSKLNLVCIDGSEQSEHAFNWYIGNYHKSDDIVGLVYVQRQPSMPILIDGGVGIEAYQISARSCQKEAENLKHKFQTICEKKNLKFKFFMLDPHHCPGHLICEIAKEEKAASIIMGQRGLGMISRILLGSTSDYVLHHTNIPVTVVPNAIKS